jgi:GNAT superfamily N-acetyltransferase
MSRIAEVIFREQGSVMLMPTSFDVVALHARGAHSGGLVLSQAMATHWYIDTDGRGFVGIKQANFSTTITALFIHPSERRLGHGSRLLRDIIAGAGSRDVEAQVEPHLHLWFTRHRFIAVHKMKKTAWLMRRPHPVMV